MLVLELLKSLFLGVVEGITEWLPISSTGHLILVDEFIKLNVTTEFMDMYRYVIQLGAILAVLLLFFHRLNPFSPRKSVRQKRDTWNLWGKVVLACIPSAVVGLPLNDWMDEHLMTPWVVAAALIIYGLGFLYVENLHRTPSIRSTGDITWKTALLIGLFQTLSIIPGTSRSGATILGAMLIGASRYIAAEFSFFLAIPVMFGASLLKLVKFGFNFTGTELAVLLVGMATAFLVSVLAIKFLMSYIKKNDFKAFGWYRIVLGILVIAYFLIAG